MGNQLWTMGLIAIAIAIAIAIDVPPQNRAFYSTSQVEKAHGNAVFRLSEAPLRLLKSHKAAHPCGNLERAHESSWEAWWNSTNC